MPRELQYMGVTHIISKVPMQGICGHMVSGPRTGHYQTDKNDFINRVSNSGMYHCYTHCHMCEALLSDFDIINATDV